METISRTLLTFLLNSLWQILLIGAVAALASRLMRQGPASHRHAVWAAALFASVLLPLASVRNSDPIAAPAFDPHLYSAIAVPGPAAQLAQPLRAVPLPAPARRNRTIPLAYATAVALLAAYALFLLARIIMFAAAWMRTLRIRREAAAAISMTPAVERVWLRCCRAFGSRSVELLCSPNVTSPVTVGAWKKTIILPEDLLRESSEDVLATAIGHEMAHIARRDFAMNILYELLYLPVSFHPAAWLIRRGIDQSREVACDELVTRRLLDPGAYARSIVSIAKTMTALPRPGLTLGVFDSDILEERIRRLMSRPVLNLRRARLALATALSGLAVCVVIASTLAITARAQSGFHGEMKAAGDAYNHGDFKAAAEHFDNAVRLDPSNIAPKLFLANALTREFFADKTQPDPRLLAQARQQYLDVLAYDAHNKQSLEGLASIAIYSKQPSDARDWAVKLTQADPKDKAGYYTAGVADWSIVYPEVQRARMQAAMKVTDNFIPAAGLRESLREQYGAKIDDGMSMLQTAIQLDPSYSDAMAYLNLLYRLKASLADTPAESNKMIAEADMWVGKALAARKLSPPDSGPSQLDVNGPPPGPASATKIVAAPPPPPPPPPPVTAAKANQPASATPPPRARNTAERPGPYWQVTGPGDLAASALVRQLNDRGFHASILGSMDDPLVRVLVGPYLNTQALQKARTDLEAAGFRPIRTW